VCKCNAQPSSQPSPNSLHANAFGICVVKNAFWSRDAFGIVPNWSQANRQGARHFWHKIWESDQPIRNGPRGQNNKQILHSAGLLPWMQIVLCTCWAERINCKKKWENNVGTSRSFDTAAGSGADGPEPSRRRPSCRPGVYDMVAEEYGSMQGPVSLEWLARKKPGKKERPESVNPE